jgi:hypothetical protein
VITGRSGLAVCMALVLGTSGLDQVHAQVAQPAAPHPAMAAFLNELDVGALDQAASRISRIGDFDDGDFFVIRPSRDELVALLKSCRQVSGAYGAVSANYGQLQRTEWGCPNNQIYSVNFWPEDALLPSGRVPRPYLMVAAIETAESRTLREEKRKAKFRTDGIPPPPNPIVYSGDQQQQLRQREERERLAAYAHRDTLGQAVLNGDFDPIAEFVTDETEVFYASRDPYFDVRIEYGRGKGLAALTTVLNRAIAELGKPVAVDCFLADGPWPPQSCRWELSVPENRMFVEMNFRGPGGTINSIRVFRETPAETNAFRQRASEAGIANG